MTTTVLRARRAVSNSEGGAAFLADAVNAPVAVMETAAEGGAYAWRFSLLIASTVAGETLEAPGQR